MTSDNPTTLPTRPRVIISEKLVVINSASFVLTRLMYISVTIWAYHYLLKRIPVEEFSVYPVVAALMVFAPVFFTVFTGSLTRSAVEAYARGDQYSVSQIVSSILPLIVGMSLVFSVVGVGLAIRIDDVLNIPPGMEDEASMMLIMLVASFAIQMIAMPFGMGFDIRQKYVELNLLGLAREVLRLVVLATLLIEHGAAVKWVVVAAVVADLTYTLAFVWRSHRLVPELRFLPRLFDRRQAKRLLSFGLWVSLGQLGMVMYTHAAAIVLNVFGSPVDVAVYFIGATIFRQLQVLLRMAAHPLMPVITTMHATGASDRVGDTLLRGGRYALWVSMFPAAALMVFAEPFVALYAGSDYLPAAFIIVIFMMIFPFDRAMSLLPMTCMAMNRVRAFFLPAFLFQLLGLVAMVVLAGPADLGAAGVVLALAGITVGSQLSYYWWFGLRLTHQTWSQFLRRVLVPGWTPGLVTGAVWLIISEFVVTDDWVKLISVVAAGGGVYFAVLLMICLDAKERRKIADLLRPVTGIVRHRP